MNLLRIVLRASPVIFCLTTGAALAQTPDAASGAAPGNSAASSPDSCAARFESVTTRGGVTYLPFSGGDVYDQVMIAVTDQTGCRNLGFLFRSRQAGALLGDRGALNYQLKATSGRRARIDGETVEPVRAWAGSTPGRFEAFASIPAGQTVRPGTYQDRLTVQLFDNGRILDEREVELITLVQAQARISVEGSSVGGFGTNSSGSGLDFGELKTGAERTAYLFIRSNANCAVEMRSENGNRLTRAQGSKPSDARTWIPYTSYVDGVKRDLARMTRLTVPVSADESFRSSMDLNVRLGDVADKLAGDYRDVITVDVLVLD